MRKAGFLSFLVLLTVAVQAQKSRPYTSGLKAGVNLYELKFDPETAGISNDTRTNFHAGLFFNIPFASMFAIQPELLYSSQGVKAKGNNYKSELSVSYVTLPIMFQVNFSGFYVEAGPALNVLAKGKEETTNNGVFSELDLKKRFTKAGVAAMGGLGYRYRNLGLNARYEYGISNLSKNNDDLEIKSNGIQVSLSWSFKQ